MSLLLRFKAQSSPLSGQPRVHSFKGQQEGKVLGDLRRKGGDLETLKATVAGNRGQWRGHSLPLTVSETMTCGHFIQKTVRTNTSFHVGRGVIILCFVCLF